MLQGHAGLGVMAVRFPLGSVVAQDMLQGPFAVGGRLILDPALEVFYEVGGYMRKIKIDIYLL